MILNQKSALASLLLCLSMLAACHSGRREAQTVPPAPVPSDTSGLLETPSVARDLGQLPDWTAYMSRNSSGTFRPQQFAFSEEDTVPLLQEHFFSPKDWAVYKRYLKYSPDSSYALDLYSYGTIPVRDSDGRVHLEGGDPDDEVALLNLKTGTRMRLLFSGPGTTYQDAKWLNDSVAIISGYSEFNDYQRMLPVVWRFNRSSRLLEVFQYRDSTFQASHLSSYVDSLH